MRIRMVGHASVVIHTSAGGILCDPWLTGKAFNESWVLRPQPILDADVYPEIDYLWISHEHPDHFSVETLRGFDESFRSRVTVLFQKRNSGKIFDAMRRWGFRNFRELPDRDEVRLSDRVAVTCYQAGLVDSALVVRDGPELVVDLNDGDLTKADLRQVRRRFGPADLVLNQFSVAAFDGNADAAKALRCAAEAKLEYMTLAHRLLDASFTLPFASFVYFSTTDNRFVNEYANSIEDVQRHFDRHGQATLVMAPGDVHTLGEPWDNGPALATLQRSHDTLGEAHFDAPTPVSTDQLATAFDELLGEFRRYYPRLLLRAIGPIRWRLSDTGDVVETDFGRGTFRVLGDDGAAPDIELCAQPLHHGLSAPYGFETLGASGRFRVVRHRRRWRRLKIISMLHNQEIHLKPPHVFNRRTLSWLRDRLLANAAGQALYKVRKRHAEG
jgi:UDP-MurNAc hydroxylase